MSGRPDAVEATCAIFFLSRKLGEKRQGRASASTRSSAGFLLVFMPSKPYPTINAESAYTQDRILYSNKWLQTSISLHYRRPMAAACLTRSTHTSNRQLAWFGSMPACSVWKTLSQDSLQIPLSSLLLTLSTLFILSHGEGVRFYHSRSVLSSRQQAPRHEHQRHPPQGF